MIRKILIRFSLFTSSLMISFLVIEVIIRLVGHYEEHGLFYFNGELLPKNQLPVVQIQMRLEEIADPDKSILIHNDVLGWTNNPGFISEDGETLINTTGIRADRDYSLQPSPNMLRIAVFGDSFTYGAEVANDETWAYYLEESLRSQGINAEVLNFGVGAYGMDQAYLRWQHIGYEYSPDIVLFGFQPVDIIRNLNIFRPLYRWDIDHTVRVGVPFSKPRFILEDNELRLINNPARSREDLEDLYANLDQSPLLQYEVGVGYDDSRFESPLLGSKFIAMIQDRLEQHANRTFSESYASPDSEEAQLTQAIVDAFAAEIHALGKTLIVVHLPTRGMDRRLERGSTLDYQAVYDYFDRNYTMIHGEDVIRAAEPYFMPMNHYSPLANQELGLLIADEIRACLENGSCLPPRFDDIDSYLLG